MCNGMGTIFPSDMTLEEAENAVAEIERTKDDDEHAHGAEDHLRESVLAVIAAGKISKQKMAKLAAIALKTSKINFSRWCA